MFEIINLMKRFFLPIFCFVFFFPFFFLLSVNKVLATTTTINPSADAMIDSLHPDSKYGSNTHLDVSHSNTPDPIAKVRSLIRFDLSSVPTNATVNSATFSIYFYGCGIWSQTIDDLNIARITASWDEYQVTWNTHKSKFDTASKIAKTAPCGSTGKYHNFDIKTFVNNWRNGTWSNYGVGLYGAELSSVSWIKFFYSREDPENKPPKLTIYYTIPSTSSPADPTITGGSSPTNSPGSSSQASNGTTSNNTSTSNSTNNLDSSGNPITDSATTSAKKSTVSATSSENKNEVSRTKIVLISLLSLLFVVIILGYIIYRRRKGGLLKKENKEVKLK